ncbi:sensitivity to red-light reduced protein [Linnemannia gamsii]|uniref:Sensitivity to red-light reduced protein n=1 Tax=Linnemannia gamsii TaxID=64522 RepID=A0ABQ7JT90_9FUNG|nr:sensitivity to red-light reduced protein [Linnemannia gamsii]
MLCSLIRKMCTTSTTSLQDTSSLQKTTSTYFNKAFNNMTASSPILSTISPPSSPAMSIESDFEDHDETTTIEQPRKIKVMIIDDNSVNLTILSRLLNKHFADTIQLTSVQNSGLAALDQLTKDEVDLILMDIDMPILSGVETTTAIRNNDSHSEHSILQQNMNVPIIAVTTSDAEEQRELYRQVGMADCVSKPIAIPKLRMAIEEAMKTVSTNG